MIKINVSHPATGMLKSYEIEDEKKLLPFFGKKIGAEIPADSIGEEWEGFVLKITGGSDKEGFPMLNGVMTNQRVRLLFHGNMKCFTPKRKGAMKKKTIRGCIVGGDLAVINLAITKAGEKDIDGLTTETRPRRLGPKRANNIRKMFGLPANESVAAYTVKRTFTRKGGQTDVKSPKIQRLVTLRRVQRKTRLNKVKKDKVKASGEKLVAYRHMLEKYHKEKHTAVSK